MFTMLATVLALSGVQATAEPAGCELVIESRIQIPDSPARLRLVARTVGAQCDESSTLVQVFSDEDRLLYTYAVQTVFLSAHENWDLESTHRVLTEWFTAIAASPVTDLPPVSEITGQATQTPEFYDFDDETYSAARREGGWVVCFPQYWEGSRCVYLDPDVSIMYDLFKHGV